MDGVFIYWDNSNIFHEAQRLAEEGEVGPDARYRVRINCDSMLRLAHADRPMRHAVAAGSVPPAMRQLWNRMESMGVEVKLFDRGSPEGPEQDMPDRLLQLTHVGRCVGQQRRPRHRRVVDRGRRRLP